VSDSISLGKNGNTGKIDFSRIKAGVKKEELVKNDSRLESVFDMVDADGDGTLNRTELDNLEQKISTLAGADSNLTKKEVKHFGEQKLGRKDRKALLEFLNKLDGVTPEDVEKVETKLVDGKQVEVVAFKDGHTEEYYPNGQKISNIVSGNKKIITTEQDGNILSEVVTENEGEENEIISTTSIVNGQKQTIINNKGNKTTSTIIYNDDKKSNETIVGENSTTVITYDEEGNPAKEVETSGTSEKTYIYQNSQKVLQSDIENKGLEGKEITKVYDSEGGYTQTQSVPNGKITTVVDKDGNVTSNVKTETVNGQELSLQLDKDGNIPGVIVQNGESPAAIAKKFGCNVNELIELNTDQLKGNGKNQYFDVGTEIKLPNTVGLERFAKANEGRKSAEDAKAEYARDVEIRKQKAEAEKQEREYYQKLGVTNFNNKGKKVKADGWGDKEFEIIGDVGYNRQLVKYDGKLYTRSHDGKILREDYLQAHKAFVSKPKTQRNNTVSGMRDVTYVKDNNGKVWYFDEKTGKAIVKDDYKKIVKQESAFVANQLYTAAKGMGTDEELLEKGVQNIYSRDILQGVNAELKTKDSDYVGDAQTMPVEALILDEMSHTAARPLFKGLINSGTMSTQEKAHTVKREIEYEVHGGLTGYTSTSDLNEIMQLCTDRDVRLEVEAQFKKDNPKLEENDGSVVRSYIAGDGWNAQEVDQFDANWVKTGAYQEAKLVYQTDENGNVLLDNDGQPVVVIDEGDQAHRNGVIGRLVFDYHNKEALNKGLDAVNDNPDSFDYQNLDKRAGEEIEKDPQGKYQSRFTNQDNIQRYLAGFHSDGTGAVDAGNVSASNTCLFKGVKPARVQAEEALYKAKNGDYSQTFDSMDAETYSAMSEIIANGDIKGVDNMTNLYNKALNDATDKNDKTKIKANAMLSGQVNFTDAEITDFCVELMHSIDANRGRGGSTGMSAGYTNSADYQTEQLKAILQNNPQVMSAVKTRVEKEDFSYTTTISSGGEMPTTTLIKTNTKDGYIQLLADTKTIANDEIFYDKNGQEITDTTEILAVKSANMQSLAQMRQYVAELERDYKKGIDSEGWLSDAANGLSRYSGLGTDRDDVATEYRNAKLMLQQFEAAAQGKLRDSQGNVISAQDLAQQMLDKQNELAQTNSDYKQTITYGKMGIVLAPVIAATTIVSGGVAAAGFGTLGVAAAGGVAAGATTYGINALEYNTSYTGNTAEAREQNLEDSVVNGATTAIGIGQMKYIGGMANNMGTVARTGIRLGTTVAADTSVGVGAEYVTTGNISKQGMISNMVMSGAGNIIGAKALGQKQVKTTPHINNEVKPQGVISEPVPHAPNTPEVSVLETATNNGSSVSGGTLNDIKFNSAMEQAHNVSADGAAAMYKQADLHQVQNSSQGKQLKQEILSSQGIEAHGKKLTANTPAGQAVVEQINLNTAQSAETILSGQNTGALAPHDAATLESHLVNTLNTKEEIELFKQQLKERVGVDEKGNMFKYEVQGKDHAADLMAKADKKLKQLADFDDVLNSIPTSGGMADLTALKTFIQKPTTTSEQLQAIFDRMNSNPAIKKFGGSKKLMSEIKTQIDGLQQKHIANVAESEPAQNPVEVKANEKNSPSTHPADDVPVERQLTPQERIEMGELSNKINRAKTSEDIAKLQKNLDKMPECSQKSRLQAQLDEKANTINIKPEVEVVRYEISAPEKGTPQDNITPVKYSSAVEQSQNFNKTHRVSADEIVMDGYKDGGRGLKFDSNGNPINRPSREIIIVDRNKDKELSKIISKVKKETANMSDKEKAAFLQNYICKISGGKNIDSMAMDNWVSMNTGREVMLGDIITAKPPVAVCRHRSLLFKILGDEVDLNIELQRGNFYTEYGGGGHAWNTVQFDDGTSAIFDAMHNKTSNITPGHVDDYAKYYLTVNNDDLYSKGLNINNHVTEKQQVKYEDFSNKNVGTTLPKNQGVVMSGTETLKLANFELDLGTPEIQAKLKAMKDGDIITVGREVYGNNDISISDPSKRVSRQHLTIEKSGDKFVITDISTNGTAISSKANTNIDPQYRATSNEFIPDELVREAGNNGRAINENYIQSSKDLREHYKKAIANGTYADSYENYVKTITEGHKVAYGGYDGQHTWYNEVGAGHIEINPGKIRGEGALHSNRTEMGEKVEKIAQKYGDNYSTSDMGTVELEGIPSVARPSNVNTMHIYPDGKYMPSYFKQMQRTAKEAVTLIENNASQDVILAKLAEHYQYAANARPFGQINNSLFMNEVNTLLQKAGMKPMPHGILDHVAQRLQPDAFQKYFIDEYKKTAL
jgi:hypothetical protein